MLTENLVVSHETWGEPEQKLKRLVLKSPVARTAKAGQFVAVQVQSSAKPSFDPLLRRPISIAEIWQSREEIALIYRIQGRGTEILAQARAGETLNVMGPLGQGFILPEKGSLWLVAGGLGAFPLYALAQSAINRSLDVSLFWGGENRQFLQSAGLDEWKKLSLPLHLTTLDGSLGEKGLVTEPLRHSLHQLRSSFTQSSSNQSGENKAGATDLPPVSGPLQIASCGPRKMLQAVTELASGYNVPVQVSLEERMGCAVGACLGCVCAVKNEAGAVIHKKVCLDGPVFRGEEVVWDDLG